MGGPEGLNLALFHNQKAFTFKGLSRVGEDIFLNQ